MFPPYMLSQFEENYASKLKLVELIPIWTDSFLHISRLTTNAKLSALILYPPTKLLVVS